MLGRLLDRAIGAFSPERGLRRMQARASMEQLEAYTGKAGYDAVIPSRLQRCLKGAEVTENSLPWAQFDNLRRLSWQLWRTTPQARKAVNALVSKVVGDGNQPQSLATKPNGKPDEKFRDRAEQLFRLLEENCDIRGRPGYGGQSWAQLDRLAFKHVILSGEVLTRFVSATAAEVRDRKLPIDTLLHVMPASRLDTFHRPDAFSPMDEPTTFRGVEFDERGRRVAYHLLPTNWAGRYIGFGDYERVPVDELIHTYLSEEIDAVRGTPWLAAAVLKISGASDYEFAETKAAEMSACVVLGYSKSAGQTQFGLNAPVGASGRDEDSNRLERMQPGMVLDLGTNGKIEGFNPQRPNSQAAPFVQHLVRMIACALPGVKGTSMTLDFAGSSYTSERAADNEVWPEILAVQDWWIKHRRKPMYDRIVRDAVIAGWFKGVVSDEDFADREMEYLAAQFSVPVQLALNPKDDTTAVPMRIKAGISSPQIEALQAGHDMGELLDQMAQFREMVIERGLPASYADQLLGILPNVGGNQMDAAAAAAEAA